MNRGSGVKMFLSVITAPIVLARIMDFLNRLYRTSGVIFFIDYCTAIRDTQKEGVEEKETSYPVHRILGHAHVA